VQLSYIFATLWSFNCDTHQLTLTYSSTYFYRATACNATHGIARPFFLSVCPSVKRVLCDKTKETCAHILKYHSS